MKRPILDDDADDVGSTVRVTVCRGGTMEVWHRSSVICALAQILTYPNSNPNPPTPHSNPNANPNPNQTQELKLKVDDLAALSPSRCAIPDWALAATHCIHVDH